MKECSCSMVAFALSDNLEICHKLLSAHRIRLRWENAPLPILLKTLSQIVSLLDVDQVVNEHL